MRFFNRPNSPMGQTQMTQHTKMSHPFIDLDQSETRFLTFHNPYTNVCLADLSAKFYRRKNRNLKSRAL